MRLSAKPLSLSSFLAVASLSCATTSIRSQVDPAAAAKGFKKVMVVGNFSDLGLRQDAEQEFVKTLAARGFYATPSAVLLFPGRQYSPEEIDQALATAGVDAVLVLSPAGAGTSSTWIPQTTTTTGSATVYGNTVSGTATSRSYGGYSVQKPWAQFHAQLFDRAARQSVWIASFDSRGNAFADWGDLVRSMARKAAGALAEQRLFEVARFVAGRVEQRD